MRLPYPIFLDRVDAVIEITDGLNSDGVPNIVDTITTKVTFNERPKQRYDNDGKTILLQGKILVVGDISPTTKTLDGTVLIDDVSYKISKGIRCRNPDGTIHHTELELM